MGTTLLVGNGLNRCLKNSFSWGDLLKKITEEFGVTYNGKIPMPLEFECIVNQYLNMQSNPSEAVYQVFKEKIAGLMKNTTLPNNAIHHVFPTLPIKAVITTNYDNLIEYAYDSGYYYEGNRTNKYLFNTTSVQNGVSFYHMHGHADSPKTICLGYEHYMGIVEKMRGEINTEVRGTTGRMKIVEALLDPSKQQNRWYEKFYTDDIGIIGLGLYESEVDLWWLITHRAYLYYSNYSGARKIINNRITYFDILDESKPEELVQKQRIHYMLKNAHVEVITYTLGKDCTIHEDAYRKMLQFVREGKLTH